MSPLLCNLYETANKLFFYLDGTSSLAHKKRPQGHQLIGRRKLVLSALIFEVPFDRNDALYRQKSVMREINKKIDVLGERGGRLPCCKAL